MTGRGNGRGNKVKASLLYLHSRSCFTVG